MKKRCWLIPVVLELIVLLIFFLLLFCFETSLATSAQILFSGSLVATSVLLFTTSFLLFTTQRAFNKHVRAKDNPDLVTVGDPERRIVEETKGGKDVHKVEFTFRVCHCAPVFAALWKVHIENSEVSNKSWEMINWTIEKIDLPKGREQLIPSQSYLPVLVKPNEITRVIFQATVDSETRDKAKNITELKWCFRYQIGNYEEKSTRYERNVARKKR